MIERESEEEVLELDAIVRRGALKVEARFWIDLIGGEDAVVLCVFPIMEVCCALCVDDCKFPLVKGPRPMPVSDDTASADVYPPGSELYLRTLLWNKHLHGDSYTVEQMWSECLLREECCLTKWQVKQSAASSLLWGEW